MPATASRPPIVNPDTRTVVLLGAQRFDPTLKSCVARHHIRGKIALVTAGWQERESEDEELSAHLGERLVNLKLHARGEELFRKDPELHTAHRERQQVLRHLQDFYRVRLEHVLEAERVIRHRSAPAAMMVEEGEASIGAIREIDAAHLARCARTHSEFEAQWEPSRRSSVAAQRAEVAELIAGCDAVAIAGGHVVTIINRLTLFAVAAAIGNRPVFAWSGGAMAVSERVVLFHDDPPQGAGAVEVLDAGVGLVPNVVCLPHPEERLKLDQPERVQVLARRFAPAACLALPSSSFVTYRDGRFTSVSRVQQLKADGRCMAFKPGRSEPP